MHAAVSRERNACAKVNKLPVELLRLIFEFHEATSRHLQYRKSPHPTFTISSVCTHWRAVALSHPAIWSRIDLTSSPRQLKYCGERARHHPLILVFELEDEEDEDDWANPTPACNFLSERLHQVVDLTIDLASGGLWSLLLTMSAPLLQRCEIYSDYHNPESFAEPLFGDFAPQLQYLKLYNLCVPWNMTYLRTLSVLVISCDAFFLPRDATIENEMCLLLIALPNIQSLELYIRAFSTEPSRIADVPRPTSRITMQHLHTLTLRMRPQVIQYILSSITTPSVRTLEMTIDAVDADSMRAVSTLCHPDVLPPGVFSCVTKLDVEVFQKGDQNILLQGFAESEDMARVFLLCWKSSRAMNTQTLHQVASDIQQYHVSPSLRTLSIESTRYLGDVISLGGLLQRPSLRCFILKGHAINPVLAELLKAATPQAANKQPEDVDLMISDCVLDVGSADAIRQWTSVSGRVIRSLDLCDVTFAVVSRNDIERVARSIFDLSNELIWDLGEHGERHFCCIDENSLCYKLKKTGDLDCGQEYTVESHRRYNHKFVVSW